MEAVIIRSVFWDTLMCNDRGATKERQQCRVSGLIMP